MTQSNMPFIRQNLLSMDKNLFYFQRDQTRSFRTSFLMDNNLSIDAVVSLENNADRLNVCISNFSDKKHPITKQYYQEVATCLFHSHLKKEGENFHRINWYSYAPGSAEQAETFEHVCMSYAQDKFQNPSFRPLDKVPEAVKHAAYYTAAQDMFELPLIDPIKAHQFPEDTAEGFIHLTKRIFGFNPK